MKILKYLASLAMQWPAIYLALVGLEHCGVTNVLTRVCCVILVFVIHDVGVVLK